MNIADDLRASAERLADKPALLHQDQPITYAQLDARADRAAAAFQACGLQPGDRVALLIGNTPAFVEALYGAWRAGLVVVPVNVEFTADEVAHVLTDSGARVVVTSEIAAPVLDGVREGLVALDEVFVTGTTDPPLGTRGWRTALAAAVDPQPVELPDDVACDATNPVGLALLQYTSGTTGAPKGAMLSHAHLRANQRQMAQTRLEVAERDIVLCVLPLFHIYALNCALAFALSRGATVLLVERFDAAATLEEVARHRASVIVGAPPLYVAWVNTQDVKHLDLASVRYAISGAAPLPASVLQRFAEEFGITVWEGYGLTETAPVLTSAAMGDQPRPGSVGQPLPDVELRLVDAHGEPVPPGDPGEVVVRGPNVFCGYWRQPSATAEVLDADGWLATGDIGYLQDGELHLVDRKKDLIIVSGFNVYPREVEEVLVRHPKVAEAGVVGAPHPYTGEAVKAVVVLEPGQEASAEEIITFSRRFLARFKCPEVVVFARELPHLPTGKVKRRELREGGP